MRDLNGQPVNVSRRIPALRMLRERDYKSVEVLLSFTENARFATAL